MEVGGLQPGEEELGGGHVVAIGPELHQRDLEPLEEALRTLGFVVAGVVPDENGVLPPVLVLGVEHLHELSQVDLHDLAVAVGLEQAVEGAPEVVDAGDECEPRDDADLLLTWATRPRLPTTSLVPDRVQPRPI